MKDWVWNIFMMTASLTFVELVLPEGRIQKYLKFIFSLIVLAVIIYPFGDNANEYINATLPLSQKGQSLSQYEDNKILEKILATQTRQLEDVYREKMASVDKPPDLDQNPGISLPWSDIYSNNEEESN